MKTFLKDMAELALVPLTIVASALASWFLLMFVIKACGTIYGWFFP